MAYQAGDAILDDEYNVFATEGLIAHEDVGPVEPICKV